MARKGLAEKGKKLNINLKLGSFGTPSDKKGFQTKKSKPFNLSLLTAKDKQRGLF